MRTTSHLYNDIYDTTLKIICVFEEILFFVYGRQGLGDPDEEDDD